MWSSGPAPGKRGSQPELNLCGFSLNPNERGERREGRERRERREREREEREERGRSDLLPHSGSQKHGETWARL